MSHARSFASNGLIRYLLAFALMLAVSSVFAARPAGEIGKDWGDPAGEECVECHMTENPGMTLEWNHSAHGQAGVNSGLSQSGERRQIRLDAQKAADLDHRVAERLLALPPDRV